MNCENMNDHKNLKMKTTEEEFLSTLSPLGMEIQTGLNVQGKSRRWLAEKLGRSRSALYYKMQGKSKFTKLEFQRLKELELL